MRSQQVFGENQNSLSIFDEPNGINYMSNQILDFPQRVKIASEFMGLEIQVFFKKICFCMNEYIRKSPKNSKNKRQNFGNIKTNLRR